jgi:hypothetical protein
VKIKTKQNKKAKQNKQTNKHTSITNKSKENIRHREWM